MAVGKQSANFRANMLVTQTTSAAAITVTNGDAYKVFNNTNTGATPVFTLPKATVGAGPFYWTVTNVNAGVTLTPRAADSIGGLTAGTSLALNGTKSLFFGIYCALAGFWTPVTDGSGTLIPGPFVTTSPLEVVNTAITVGFEVQVNATLSGTAPVIGAWFTSGTEAMTAIDFGNNGFMAYPNSGTNAGAGLYIINNGYHNGTNYVYKTTGSLALWYADAANNTALGVYGAASGTAGTTATIASRVQVTVAGAVTITPASGTQALGITGLGAVPTQTNSANTAGQACYSATPTAPGPAFYSSVVLCNGLVLNSTGADFGCVANIGTQIWALGYTAALSTLATGAIGWGVAKIGFFGISSAPIAQSTGYGTPTGNVKTSSFPGATATLVQTSEMVAQLILDLKAYGLLGA